MGSRDESADKWAEGLFAPAGQDETFRGAHEARHKGSVAFPQGRTVSCLQVTDANKNLNQLIGWKHFPDFLSVLLQLFTDL